MANYAKWNVRLRHEWLAKPLKAKRLKRRQKARIGLLEAEQRKGTDGEAEREQPAAEANG